MDDILAQNGGSSGRATEYIHAGSASSNWTHSPIMPPVYISTTYEVLDPGNVFYEYSRSNNPTRDELQRHLKTLESAEYALAFSSGIGALTTSTYLLRAGDHILSCDDVYGGTHRFLSKCSTRMSIETTFIDGTEVQNWVKNFRPGKTKMVWIETPTNPTMKIIDILKVSQAVKELDPKCIVVVDNTFMTPIFQSPLELGADIVMHSVTKFINGHSDVIMGALITNSKELFDELKFLQNALGVIASPHDCSLVIRSIYTLEVRIRQQASSAMEVARYLESQPNVERTLYPGLESHPQYDVGKSQTRGFGSLISIYIKAPKGDESIKLLRALKVFHSAVSLGCVCSLIQVPSLMTHTAVPREERLKLGIVDNLLRLSIGLETTKDLINDLDQAFKIVYA